MNQSTQEYQIVHVRTMPDDTLPSVDEGLLIYGSPLIKVWASSDTHDLFNAVLGLELELVKLKFNGEIILDVDEEAYTLTIPETITIGPFPQTNELNLVLNAYGLRFDIYEYDFRLVADLEQLSPEALADSVTRIRSFIRYVGSINVEALDLIGRFWSHVLDPLVNDVNRQLDSRLVLDLPPEFRRFDG